MSLLRTHQTLKELFPQVDDRLLKAAALEHGHEVEFAIEFVVDEVLPHISLHNEHTNGLNGTCFTTGDEFASSAENQEAHFTLESHKDFPALTHANATRMSDSSFNFSEDASSIPVYRIESHNDFPTLATASRFPDTSTDIVEDSTTPGLASAECCAHSEAAENSLNLVPDTISKTVGLSDLYMGIDELLVPFERKVNASNIDDSEPWKQISDDGHESLVSEEN